MKFKFFLLFLIFSCFPLLASTYMISDYVVNNSGKTKNYALETLLKDRTRFDSKESLLEYLEIKKQELINLRLFKMVKLDYELSAERVSENDIIYVTLICDVTESSSLFIMPYPKYDSNTGFTLGLKIKENNLAGTLSQLNGSVEMISNGLAFNSSQINFDIPVTDFPLLNGSSSFGINGSLKLGDNINNNLGYNFSLNDLNIFNAVFNFKTEGLFYFNNHDKSFLTAEATMDDLFVFKDYNINTSVYFKLNPFSFKLNESKFKLKFGNINQGLNFEINAIPSPDYFWGSKSFLQFNAYLNRDIKINKPSNIKLNTIFKISPYKDERYNLKPDKLDNDIIFSSDENLEIRSQLLFDFINKNYKTKTSLGFTAFNFFQPRGIVKTYSKNEINKIERIDLDFDLSATFSFFSDKLVFYPEITIYDILDYGSKDKTKSNTFIEFMFLSTFTGGKVNYYSANLPYWTFRDNFRYGLEYGVESALRYTITKNLKYFFRGYLEAFLKIGDYFNPSIRLYASVSDSPYNWFNQEKNNEYTVVSDSDSDYYYKFNAYNFNDFNFTPNSLNEILRGIRLDNTDVAIGGPKSNFVFTGNINLVYGLINFEEFAHIYIYPFYDFALFANPLKYLHSVGFEMVTIMDNHPSYPIRISLGFNMDSLINKLKSRNNSLEYEVFIGLGWLF